MEWSGDVGARSLVQSEGSGVATVCATGIITLTVGPACCLPGWLLSLLRVLRLQTPRRPHSLWLPAHPASANIPGQLLEATCLVFHQSPAQAQGDTWDSVFNWKGNV